METASPVTVRLLGWALTLSISVTVSLLLLPVPASSQSTNGAISGTITDASDAVIPGAGISLTHLARNITLKTVSGPYGTYSFPNIEPGLYDLAVSAARFRPAIQKEIWVDVSRLIRIDVKLEIGTDVQMVEVEAIAPQLNFDNAARTEGVESTTINQLPLATGGNMRTVANFIVLLPGVTTGNGNNSYDARVNGGMVTGDEAIMDGASMQEGFMSQSGMVSFFDFRLTPDMIAEFQVKTSSYEPEYGASTGGQIIATTKSGTTQFHGAVYEYLHNKSLNATQWQINRPAGDARKKDNENNFGFAIGGPAKIPKIYNTDRARTFFYFVYEGFRQRGGANAPTLTVPTEKMRNGDFSEWPQAIYDPTSTRLNPDFNSSQAVSESNPQYLRDKFQGNILPPNRIQNSLAQGFYKYLPLPNKPGITANYLVPQAIPDGILGDATEWMLKIDQYVGSKDHIAATLWRQKTPAKFLSILPLQIASESFSDPQNAWVNRANWDHTFSPALLNHFTFGYLNRNEGYGAVNYTYADDLPQVAGVPSHDNPPQVNLNGYLTMGNSTGSNCCAVTKRPTFVYSDMLTWAKGRHTIKGGFEFRNITGNVHNAGNSAGTFTFDPAQTGLPTEPGSGNAAASFLLGAVNNASVGLYSVRGNYIRQNALIFHIGDTWKVTSKLSLNYGLRWDRFSPSKEKYDNTSFFDWGPNPQAGNRPGRLAFAGDKWGAASAGVRYPEQLWNAGFGPRLGVAYAVNGKTVIRTGYGIFYTQAFYPGWGGGVTQDGFNSSPTLGATGPGGLDPAFYWQDGFPMGKITTPPFIDGGFLNGQSGPNYRPTDGNRLSYSQQWNFTIERQLPNNIMVSVAYVGNKGTRLPSQISPINVLNPSLLGHYGNSLTQPFTGEGQTVAGVGEPYPGWYTQMATYGCTPNVAQALLPYPQYCGSLTGLNENLGSSTYNSFQLKFEKRFSKGLYALVSYNRSKIITSAPGYTQSVSGIWNGSNSVISPYEQWRNKSIAPDDVPNSFSAAAVYELPFGKGKRFLNSGGPNNWFLGGWQISTTMKFSSGTPFWFRSGTCGVPTQFRAACIPAVLSGADPFTSDVGSYDPGTGKPLFNPDSFEPVSNFTGVGYWGVGPRISNYRGQGYRNVDIGLAKRTMIGEHVAFIIRAEAFNAFNWHSFTCTGHAGCQAFNTSLDDPNFGAWSGFVSWPRNIQLSGRIEF